MEYGEWTVISNNKSLNTEPNSSWLGEKKTGGFLPPVSKRNLPSHLSDYDINRNIYQSKYLPNGK